MSISQPDGPGSPWLITCDTGGCDAAILLAAAADWHIAHRRLETLCPLHAVERGAAANGPTPCREPAWCCGADVWFTKGAMHDPACASCGLSVSETLRKRAAIVAAEALGVAS